MPTLHIQAEPSPVTIAVEETALIVIDMPVSYTHLTLPTSDLV